MGNGGVGKGGEGTGERQNRGVMSITKPIPLIKPVGERRQDDKKITI